MELLGGIAGGETRKLHFTFAPVNGALEIILHDLLEYCRRNNVSHPEWLTRFLTEIIETLFDISVRSHRCEATSLIKQLCVADRQYILLQWRIQNCPPVEWFTCECASCKKNYDFPLHWRSLPVKPASHQFPYAKTEISLGLCVVRAVNGEDQHWLAATNMSAQQIHNVLAARLVVRLDGEIIVEGKLNNIALELNAADVKAIEDAVEAVAPEMAESMQLECPECGANQHVKIDFYQGVVKPIENLLDDVHNLAVNYHWGEAEILRLPSYRRGQYLQRLDKSRGMQTQSPLNSGLYQKAVL